ncbi:MAG: cytochrome c [candidate division Zixibacteria bacterium]|nr:cytochrome c [candidate division Zixibacteria bacterium]MDH4034324.1 cytochrome c [candidate division Zixibacteria bacterium]
MLSLVAVIPGCHRGRPSQDTPIHVVPNMDDQPRYEAQEAGPFFDNNMAMRKPIEGTIARGQLTTDMVYNTGFVVDSQLVKKSPLPISMHLLKRGQERFDIFCSPCHGRVGDGKGVMSQRGMLPPPTLHDERMRNIEDGHIFNVITNGKNNMAAYRFQVPVADRWAIVAYVRALQRSQNATADDLPPPPVDTTQQDRTE